MSAATREQRIKAIALDVGFSVVGIADTAPHDSVNQANERWLDRGMHGEMQYLVRHREMRRDVSSLLPGVRSAICVGLNYYQPVEQEQRSMDGSNGRGRFSVYAQGEDYHVVMERMLVELRIRLEALYPGVNTVVCCDTKPVSDRAMALRAGIAWLGKNTSVISPQFGSWVFLGELLTDLELAPDAPLETLCAQCTRCIDACPTGALGEPFVVNARKCISYLTIEKRGEIPTELRGKIGIDLYGCDTCQSVCPYNCVKQPSAVFSRQDRSPLVDMSLEQLLTISDHDFAGHTRGSPIQRCKPESMRRNAAIVLANISENKHVR